MTGPYDWADDAEYLVPEWKKAPDGDGNPFFSAATAVFVPVIVVGLYDILGVAGLFAPLLAGWGLVWLGFRRGNRNEVAR